MNVKFYHEVAMVQVLIVTLLIFLIGIEDTHGLNFIDAIVSGWFYWVGSGVSFFVFFLVRNSWESKFLKSSRLTEIKAQQAKNKSSTNVNPS